MCLGEFLGLGRAQRLNFVMRRWDLVFGGQGQCWQTTGLCALCTLQAGGTLSVAVPTYGGPASPTLE